MPLTSHFYAVDYTRRVKTIFVCNFDLFMVFATHKSGG